MPNDGPDAAARPRKERSENAAMRRGQLIKAALNSIVKNGLPGTTLATVAREAGLSQGVAVFYFQTKEGLLAAALERHYQLYEANWRTALKAAENNPAARLAALVWADFQPEVCAREAQIVPTEHLQGLIRPQANHARGRFRTADDDDAAVGRQLRNCRENRRVKRRLR